MKNNLTKISLGLLIPVVIIILFIIKSPWANELFPYLILLGWINLLFILSLALIHTNFAIKKSTRLFIVSTLFVLSIFLVLFLLFQGVIDFTANAIMTAALGISALLNGQYMRRKLQLD